MSANCIRGAEHGDTRSRRLDDPATARYHLPARHAHKFVFDPRFAAELARLDQSQTTPSSQMSDLEDSQESELERLVVGQSRSFHQQRRQWSSIRPWQRRWFSTFVCSLIAGVLGYAVRSIFDPSTDGQGKQPSPREPLPLAEEDPSA